jgi:hypothetical protein
VASAASGRIGRSGCLNCAVRRRSDALQGSARGPSYAREPRARIAPDRLIARPSTSTWETVGVPESPTVLTTSTKRPMKHTKAPSAGRLFIAEEYRHLPQGEVDRWRSTNLVADDKR